LPRRASRLPYFGSIENTNVIVPLLPWIAHPLFVALVWGGAWSEEIGRVGVSIFAALWLTGFFALRLLPVGPAGSLLFTSYVAMLDVALVIVVFKSDIRLH
jgi:hypothetical protein